LERGLSSPMPRSDFTQLIRTQNTFSPLTPALSPLRGEGRESKDERSSES
jgi:hypothetical protein